MPRFDRIFASLALGAVLLLTGCDRLPKPDARGVADAKAVYDQLAKDDVAGLLDRMSPELRAQSTAAGLENLRAKLPPGKILSIKPILSTSYGTALAAAVQYEYPAHYTLLMTEFRSGAPGQADQLTSLHVRVATRAEVQANGFSLAHKTPAEYGFLAVFCLSILATLFALVEIVRYPTKGRWFWFAGVLIGLGFGQVSMNWMTGHMAFQLISVGLPSFGIAHGASVFQPWVLSLRLPIVTVMVLAQIPEFRAWDRRVKAAQRRREEEARTTPPDS